MFRLMYWTDWGFSPNIMVATYGGANKRKLVDNFNIRWPNGAYLDTIGMLIRGRPFSIQEGAGFFEKNSLFHF